MNRAHRQTMNHEANKCHCLMMDEAGVLTRSLFDKLEDTVATQADVIQAQPDENQDTHKQFTEDMRLQSEDFNKAFNHVANTAQTMGTIVHGMHTEMQSLATQMTSFNATNNTQSTLNTGSETNVTGNTSGAGGAPPGGRGNVGTQWQKWSPRQRSRWSPQEVVVVEVVAVGPNVSDPLRSPMGPCKP
jgi:hypothetical protein